MAKYLLGPSTHLFPMLVLLLAVRTGEGANIMTVVWAGIAGNGPPLVALRIGGFHYSSPFIDRETSFTLNVPSRKQVLGVDYCGTISGRDDPDKARTCGWTLAPSTQVSSPIIFDCPVSFECRVVQKSLVGKGAIYIVEVVETHANKGLVIGHKDIDASRLDPIVWGPDGYYYCLGERLGKGYEIGASLASSNTPRTD